MIIHGDVSSITIAIYGMVAADTNHPTNPLSENFSPGIVAGSQPPSLHSSLDVARSYDPARLARQLLSLLPSPPSLSVAIRLTFCIKPNKEDWSSSTFPLFMDVGKTPQSVDESLTLLGRPFPENTSINEASQLVHSISAHFLKVLPSHVRKD
jgi:hypothetical protein